MSLSRELAAIQEGGKASNSVHLGIDVGYHAADAPGGVEREVHVLDLLEDGELRPLV